MYNLYFYRIWIAATSLTRAVDYYSNKLGFILRDKSGSRNSIHERHIRFANGEITLFEQNPLVKSPELEKHLARHGDGIYSPLYSHRKSPSLEELTASDPHPIGVTSIRELLTAIPKLKNAEEVLTSRLNFAPNVSPFPP